MSVIRQQIDFFRTESARPRDEQLKRPHECSAKNTMRKWQHDWRRKRKGLCWSNKNNGLLSSCGWAVIVFTLVYCAFACCRSCAVAEFLIDRPFRPCFAARASSCSLSSIVVVRAALTKCVCRAAEERRIKKAAAREERRVKEQQLMEEQDRQSQKEARERKEREAEAKRRAEREKHARELLEADDRRRAELQRIMREAAEQEQRRQIEAERERVKREQAEREARQRAEQERKEREEEERRRLAEMEQMRREETEALLANEQRARERLEEERRRENEISLMAAADLESRRMMEKRENEKRMRALAEQEERRQKAEAEQRENERMEKERRQHAALTIQRVWRGYRARKERRRLQNERELLRYAQLRPNCVSASRSGMCCLVLVVVSLLRASLAFVRFCNCFVRAFGSLLIVSLAVCCSKRRETAAVCLQAAYRGHRWRKVVFCFFAFGAVTPRFRAVVVICCAVVCMSSHRECGLLLCSPITARCLPFGGSPVTGGLADSSGFASWHSDIVHALFMLLFVFAARPTPQTSAVAHSSAAATAKPRGCKNTGCVEGIQAEEEAQSDQVCVLLLC